MVSNVTMNSLMFERAAHYGQCIHTFKGLTGIAHESNSVPQKNDQRENEKHASAPSPRTSKCVGTRNCCLAHKHKQPSGPAPLLENGRRLLSHPSAWIPLYRQ